jgi:pimeloyl-ACP methyl ester carboxylesterase
MSMTRFFPARRGRLAYTDTGVGTPAVVLMHGLPTAKEIFAPVLPHMDPPGSMPSGSSGTFQARGWCSSRTAPTSFRWIPLAGSPKRSTASS